MLFGPLKWAWSLLVTFCVMYVVFFVPLGRRTIYEHVRRIAATDEARDLGDEVSHAGRRVIDHAQTEIRQGLRHDGGLAVDPLRVTPTTRSLESTATRTSPRK